MIKECLWINMIYLEFEELRLIILTVNNDTMLIVMLASLKCLMEEPELLTLEFPEDKNDYFYLKLNRDRIDDLGKSAIEKFILKLE